MRKAEPKEKDAAMAARQQAEERDAMRQRRIRNRKLLETEEPVVISRWLINNYVGRNYDYIQP